MQYLWTNDVKFERHSPLRGEVHCDVCVIGGGMAGVLCAAKLQADGVDTVIACAGELGDGITKGTTAVLSAQHDIQYSKIGKMYGANAAKLYLKANLDALRRYEAAASGIDCDFEHRPSVMYSLTGTDGLEDEARFLNKLGFAAEYTKRNLLPFTTVDAVIYPNMAQFHPLKFLNGMASGLKVYTNTVVRRLEGTVAYADGGRIVADKVIVATHFPFINRHGMYFVKQYQKRSYVIVYENASELGLTAVSAGEGLYFRNYRGRLIVGGGDHRTGKYCGGYELIERFMSRNFKNAHEVCRFANQDCVTLDGIPYIGRYSRAMPGVYVATGFNLWGMTTSMVASELLSDMILGRTNRYEALFDPQRSMLHPGLFANLGATVAGFAFPTLKRCPHLGCALRYNRAEHTWDCPCHGSRFDSCGELIDNPATRDANV